MERFCLKNASISNQVFKSTCFGLEQNEEFALYSKLMNEASSTPQMNTPLQPAKGDVSNRQGAILIQRWRDVKARIERAKALAHREHETVDLLAVSKTFPLSDIVQLKAMGQMDFGENYIQEAVQKIEAATHIPAMQDARWHCIGPLQSNKTKWVAQCFDWVHALESSKHAQRLHEQRPDHLPALNVLIQVNVDQGQTKSGVSVQEVLPLAKEMMSLSRLRLRGVMTMPDFVPQYDAQLDLHLKGRAVFELLQNEWGPERIDTLSMGMTQDLEAAIQAGSTLLRVGTAIFGGRA